MDFDDTSEEAAFRREARAWLDANAERLGAGESAPGLEVRSRPGMVQRAQADAGRDRQL